MSAPPKHVLATAVFCGAVASLGLLTVDRMAEQADFQPLAELPPAGLTEGRFAQERALGDELLGRTCIRSRCLAHIRTDSEPRSFGPEFDQGADLRLLRSPSRKTLLLEANGDALAVMDDDPAAWDWRAPTVFDTGVWLRSFPSLVATALFGLMASLLLLVFRSRVGRRLAVLANASEGRIDDGWLRLSDASPPRRVGGVDNGPVLVHRARSTADPYRGDQEDGTFEILDGDREDNTRPLKRRARRLDVATTVIALGTALPLLAAMTASLLL